MLRYSTACVQLAKDSEGFAPYPAPDPVGLSTVGYGHKCLPGEHYTGRMSEEDADALLTSDLDKAWQVLDNNVTVDLSQGQVDALTDWIFNLGGGRFTGSTLLKKINADDPTAADELLKWDHAGSQVLPGLQIRREKERALYIA